MEIGLNASVYVGKQPIMVATASTEHPIGCCLPMGCSVEAVATMIGCLPTQTLAFSPVSIQTQCTQRKRLRLDGNRALQQHRRHTDPLLTQFHLSVAYRIASVESRD